jgi:hypothetical protein
MGPEEEDMRCWVVVFAVCLALLLGAPLAWWLQGPGTSAGVPVEEVLAETSTTTATGVAEPEAAGPGPGTALSPVIRSADVPAWAEMVVPRRLRVATVGVDTAIDPVGVEDDGSMVIPRDAARVGWYRYGAAPGSAEGAAVIAGHVDSSVQGQGALFRLREVAVGDLVEVDNGDGTTARFRVISRERIVKAALPTERLFTRVGPPLLVLITCGGPFDRALRSYQDNLVVLAEPLP